MEAGSGLFLVLMPRTVVFDAMHGLFTGAGSLVQNINHVLIVYFPLLN